MRITGKNYSREIIILILTIMFALCNTGFAQQKKATIKIGTYDSRTVIFAWSRTDYLMQHIMKLNQQTDSVRKAHDTAAYRNLSVQAISYQHLLHQMVFSNGSVASVMKIIKDKLPELAKASGVNVIVSKWELNYSDPAFEIVDLTREVAALFQPKDNIDKMAADIASQAPIPIEELGIEIEMLDGYCKMFGKK